MIFAGTTEGLLRSEDGGKIWRIVSPHAVKAISFDPSDPGRIFFASSTGGILISTDSGQTLHESNFGFVNRNFTAMAGAGSVIYETRFTSRVPEESTHRPLRAPLGPPGQELRRPDADPFRRPRPA